ncbi:hypothetical protein MAC_00524 [Metarhizium acridum CQMa 102]|uniref:Uncharacterized protein n=1 Tax=Metarhizium acridum (strain CQMa 102) TaxID=655827 RepID=E9DSC6_METAQ|nr:uncharacterized protein MAC_00524 [Metarhizium acridum CQMa 102]EFY93286.1 hypothetical protein MAC_00524 [Metarhizium acridum CQMa 102]
MSNSRCGNMAAITQSKWCEEPDILTLFKCPRITPIASNQPQQPVHPHRRRKPRSPIQQPNLPRRPPHAVKEPLAVHALLYLVRERPQRALIRVQRRPHALALGRSTIYTLGETLAPPPDVSSNLARKHIGPNHGRRRPQPARRRAVARVAHERDPAARPRLQLDQPLRLAVEVVALKHRIQQLVRPPSRAAELVLKRPLLALHVPPLHEPQTLRDVLAAQIHLQLVRVAPPREHEPAPGGNIRRRNIRRRLALPNRLRYPQVRNILAQSAETPLLRVKHHPPRAGAQAIRTDDEVELAHASIRKPHLDACRALGVLVAINPRAKDVLDPVPRSVVHDATQVAAHDFVFRSEALRPLARGIRPEKRPPRAVRVDNLDALLRRAVGPELGLEPNALHDGDAVPAQVQLEPVYAEPREPLDHGDGVAQLGEPERERYARDARAADEDPEPAHGLLGL